jgi:hypothetical protein
MNKINSKFQTTCILLVVATLFLAVCACSTGNGTVEIAPTDVSPDTEPESGEVEIEPTSPPMSIEDEMEMLEKWRIPVASGVLVSVVCDSLLETATRRDSGEIDGMEALGEVIGAGMLLEGVDEGLLGWEPISEQSLYKDEILGYVESIKAIVGSWVDQEIDSAEVLNELPSICESATVTAENIMTAANAEGLSEEDLDSFFEELAQSLEDAMVEDEESVETLLEVVEVGFGRSNPYAPSELVQAPNWDLQILDHLRGADAWTAIQAANQFNDPPPEGMEYLLLKLYVRSTYSDDDEHNISNWDFNLTGDRLIRYGPASVVTPDPQLDFTVYTGGEGEGWISFPIGEGESNLILIFDEFANFDDDRFRYIAVEEGAKVEVPLEVRDIQPTDLGMQRTNPAPLGQTVTTEDWEVTVQDVIRGEEAWLMAEDANMFNDPPDEDMEYIAVTFHVRYIGTGESFESIDSSFFNTTGDNGVVYDIPSVVDPEPALDAALFPGGEYTGWIVLQAAEGETGMKVIFQPWTDFTDENKRFLALE